MTAFDHKIGNSESPAVSHQQFTMVVVSGENFLLVSETYQNCGGGDEWCYYLSSEAETGLLPL